MVLRSLPTVSIRFSRSCRGTKRGGGVGSLFLFVRFQGNLEVFKK